MKLQKLLFLSVVLIVGNAASNSSKQTSFNSTNQLQTWFSPYTENYTIYNTFYPQNQITAYLNHLSCTSNNAISPQVPVCIPAANNPSRTTECRVYFSPATNCNTISFQSTACLIQGCDQCDSSGAYCLNCSDSYYQVLPTPTELLSAVYTIYCYPKKFVSNTQELDNNGAVQYINVDPTLSNNSTNTNSALDFSNDIFQATFGNDICWFETRVYMNLLMKQSYYYKYLGYIILEGMFFNAISTCSLFQTQYSDLFGNRRTYLSWNQIINTSNKQCQFTTSMTSLLTTISGQTCFNTIITLQPGSSFYDAVTMLDQVISTTNGFQTANVAAATPGNRVLLAKHKQTSSVMDSSFAMSLVGILNHEKLQSMQTKMSRYLQLELDTYTNDYPDSCCVGDICWDGNNEITISDLSSYLDGYSSLKNCVYIILAIQCILCIVGFVYLIWGQIHIFRSKHLHVETRQHQSPHQSQHIRPHTPIPSHQSENVAVTTQPQVNEIVFYKNLHI